MTVLDDDLSWQNFPLQYDVNHDGKEDITDLLALVYYFNTGGVGPIPEGPPTLFYDVTGDRFFDIRDILAMVYYYNTVIVGQGEGEARPATLVEPEAPELSLPLEDDLLDLLTWQMAGQRKRKG